MKKRLRSSTFLSLKQAIREHHHNLCPHYSNQQTNKSSARIRKAKENLNTLNLKNISIVQIMIDITKCYSADEAIKERKKWLQTWSAWCDYHLLSNNCEHNIISPWCKTGQAFSRQSQHSQDQKTNMLLCHEKRYCTSGTEAM